MGITHFQLTHSQLPSDLIVSLSSFKRVKPIATKIQLTNDKQIGRYYFKKKITMSLHLVMGLFP